MFDFSDQVIMVTGATGSLGRATVRAFLQAGGRVVAVGRSLADVEEKRDSGVFGPDHADRIVAAAANLLDESSVTEMVAGVVADLGRVDALVNVAGGFKMGSPLHETDTDTGEFMLNLNARSVFFMAKAVVPHMLAQEHGKIVNIAARAALAGKAKMGPYVISKAAVVRLTETLSAETKASGINVNAILPGTIDTPPNRADMPNANFDNWVKPDAIADAILFLCSDAARAVHGAALPVYGLS